MPTIDGYIYVVHEIRTIKVQGIGTISEGVTRSWLIGGTELSEVISPATLIAPLADIIGRVGDGGAIITKADTSFVKNGVLKNDASRHTDFLDLDRHLTMTSKVTGGGVLCYCVLASASE